jgi:AAA domain
VLSPKSEEEYRLMSEDRRTRYLLANLLGYHKREEKPQWWTYFDRCDNLDDLLEFDRDSIAGMRLREDVPPRAITKRSKIYTYEFPEQNHKLAAGDGVDNPRTKKGAGTITSLDDDSGLLELKTTATPESARLLRELIPTQPIGSREQRGALARIARSFLAGRLESEYPACYDLLAARAPRVRSFPIVQPPQLDAASISARAAALERSYLFIQGPPGSGKSTYASQVICDLLQAGKRVAVTSTSHAAIHNLLHKVEACSARRGQKFDGLYKHSTTSASSEFRSELPSPMILSTNDLKAFAEQHYDLAGGTSYLFAREDLAGTFDYLFIDEAGQVALGDALAVSLCAQNVVLLGDPSQLAQVSQGSHALHADDSVLAHLLGDAPTVAPDRGIFLEVTYRMQPEICAFISDAMYEGRLHSAARAREHRVTMGTQNFAGLYFAPVEHTGNSSSSIEEAGEIERLVRQLWPYERHIIVVTPYNAQRRLIARKLTEGRFDLRVGTVDKFQGQEAAVVFYSMATSSGEEMPRSMRFLFERNRFNVAISRARAASVLVCSPRLLDISCRSPEEMALANLLCAFVERATRLLQGEGDGCSAVAAVDLEAPGNRR